MEDDKALRQAETAVSVARSRPGVGRVATEETPFVGNSRPDRKRAERVGVDFAGSTGRPDPTPETA
ncbi:hypothetical protein BRD18_06755 [Halobacteriales archaeon SW_7_71_33]|nr:MAG: hypothetical protein BRD18_06755 [Halobacteriales archaeon SW_7_71_33]